MASCRPMPRRSKKILKAREEKAHEQWWALLEMTPLNVSEDELRRVEEEIAQIESMTDEELQAYYSTPEGLVEIAQEREFNLQWEATPIEQRSNPLGRKLIRRGKLEFYREIHTRLIRGMPRKKIAHELGLLYGRKISSDTVKVAIRGLRKLTGQDYRHHHHRGEDFNKCSQCRGYAYQGSNFYGEDKRRLQRKKKLDGTVIPISQLADNDDDKSDGDPLGWLEYQNVQQAGNRRAAAKVRK